MGRPAKKRKKSKRISFRVSQEAYEILRIIADYAGMNLSDLIRSYLLTLVLQFKTGTPIRLVEVDLNEYNNLSLSD